MANKTIQSNSNIKYLIWGIVVIALAVFVITTKFVDKDILKVSYMNPDTLAGQAITTSSVDRSSDFIVRSLGQEILQDSIDLYVSQITSDPIYNHTITVRNNTTNSLSELSITIPSLAMISFDSSVSDMQGVSINTKTNTIEIDTLPANSIVSLYSFVSEKEIIPLTEKSIEQTNEEIIETPRGIFHSIGLFFKRIKCKTEGTTYYSSFDEYPGTLGTWLGPGCY